MFKKNTNLLLFLLLVLILIMLSFFFVESEQFKTSDGNNNTLYTNRLVKDNHTLEVNSLIENKFKSCADLKSFIVSKASNVNNSYKNLRSSSGDDVVYTLYDMYERLPSEDVREVVISDLDIVKTDGKYIYLLELPKRDDGNLLSQPKFYIIQAVPTKDAKLLSVTSIDVTLTYQDWSYPNHYELYIQDDKAFMVIREDSMEYTHVYVYDIKNKTRPLLLKKYEFDSYYSESVVLDGNVYVLLLKRINQDDSLELPKYYIDGRAFNLSDCSDIYYVNQTNSQKYVSMIIKISLRDLDKERLESISILGYYRHLYAADNSIYVYNVPVLQDFLRNPNNLLQTLISKVSVNNKSMKYSGALLLRGFLSGRSFINQESRHLRILSTSTKQQNLSQTNNLQYFDVDEYIDLGLNNELKIASVNETVVRSLFIDDMLYLITTTKKDSIIRIVELNSSYIPIEVGNLSLKSRMIDHLIPYNKTRLIGIGTELIESDDGVVSYLQGLVIVTFDVSDKINPKEIDYFITRDKFDSELFSNYKAILFDPNNGIVAFPAITIIKEKKDVVGNSTSSNVIFDGMYLFKITDEGKIKFYGKITHFSDDELKTLASRNIDSAKSVPKTAKRIRRALVIDNNLYTISAASVLINDISTLEERKRIDLTN
ncbi:MAG: beta-propeller domain-containing protein [Candidatus Micrarchaeota archaeon]|nr:beta-propeller domain-containing protein [Candidatus Micrarchaeota archaeon]